MKNLISNRSRSKAVDGGAESRVDYLADNLGLTREIVISILNQLRQIGLLADTKDLIAYLTREDKASRSSQTLVTHSVIEQALLLALDEEESAYNLKEINEALEEQGCKNCTVEKIQSILRFWKKRKYIEFQFSDRERGYIRLAFKEPKDNLKSKQQKRLELADFTIRYLFDLQDRRVDINKQADSIVDFSVHEILKAYEDSPQLFREQFVIADIEEAILYLSHIEALNIDGGFLVLYNPMTIQRLEDDPRRRFKKEDYQKLGQHYESKMQQIHIVGEYARRMIDDYKDALQFVDDYFHLNYSAFLEKYFKGDRRAEITRNITPKKFRELFGELSPTQLNIIKDTESQYIAVLAGPGSGKTRILVHKLASLILMEEIKTDQLLMLTFSRAAATEFKVRLTRLIHQAANFIDIKTFHSYCFDLLGKIGTLEKSEKLLLMLSSAFPVVR
jgi:ATP-dependent DNA helicase RecQ